jgi:hypothetical protein
MMKQSSLLRIFTIASMAALFMSYLGIWIRLISNPVERTGADFIHFFSAGRIAQLYGPTHVYNLALQHDIEEEQVGFPLAAEQVLPYNHLPFLIPILRVLVSADYVASFYRWVILMVIIYVLGLTLLGHLLERAGIERRSVMIARIGGLLFLPLFFSLMNGQDTAILFLGAVIWVYGLISGRPVLSGIGLSLTTIRPHIALLLSIPMAFRERKVFLGFILGSGTLAVLSFSILGIQGTYEFIDMLLLSAGGRWYGMKQEAMFNLIGLLLRIAPGLGADTIRLIGWVVYAVTVVGLCMLWARHEGPKGGPIGLTITLALFVAPHLHFHDLTLLLIPIYEILRTGGESGNLEVPLVVAAPMAISILLLVSNISPLLQYTTPYLIMLALSAYPFYLKSRASAKALHRS